ncbi:tyrosine-type recombinase/integrase [Atopobium fossor]|uniref:tyrosine-type recombinase/integrase n=1 Tax=Atopobium fossor TaxID=39487 RepID=UPI000421B3E1|nr:site-specific integrase [Atopobium fossor]
MKAEVKQGTDGVWYVRPYLGVDAHGKQIKPYHSFPNASTREQAQALADVWLKHLTADGKVKSSLLVDLLHDYIELKERNGASPNSVRSYKLFTDNYVRRFLGTAQAAKLTVMDLNRFETSLRKPKADGGAGLARNSVLAIHHFLRGAYNYFVDAGICETNPLFYVAKPSPERHEAVSLSEWDFPTIASELEKLMQPQELTEATIREATYATAAWIALHTGMRVGEVCALRLKDIRRTQRYIHVGGTVIEKTHETPYRRDVTKGRKHRNIAVTQSDMRVLDGYISLRNGFLDDDIRPTPLLTLDGSYMRPTQVSRAFKRICKRLRLPSRFTFHGLRHTHATWCLAHGVDLKTLSERLGHADEATTLRIYAHVMPGRDTAAAAAFAQAADDARQEGSE